MPLPRVLPSPPARAHLAEEGLPLLGLVGLQAAQQEVLRARRVVGLAREEAEALLHHRVLVLGRLVPLVVDLAQQARARICIYIYIHIDICIYIYLYS